MADVPELPGRAGDGDVHRHRGRRPRCARRSATPPPTRCSASTTTWSAGQIAEHHGHDLQAALGDGFLAVFVSTRRAIACAVVDPAGARRLQPEHVRPAVAGADRAQHRRGRVAGRPDLGRSRPRCGPGVRGGGRRRGPRVRRHPPARGHCARRRLRRPGRVRAEGLPAAVAPVGARVAARAPAGGAPEVFVGREAELAELRRHLRAPSTAAAGWCWSAASRASARPRW